MKLIELIEPNTDRLKLRQWRMSDREVFAELNASSKVMEFFPKRLDRTESDAAAERCQALIAERGWGLWAVELKLTEAFIGFVGLNVPAPELPISPCVEIGWRLAEEHWGMGYATEAARAALEVGFLSLGLQEIVAFAAKANIRSRAIMEKLGMRHSGETFGHPHVPENSELHKQYLYRLGRDNWQASNA